VRSVRGVGIVCGDLEAALGGDGQRPLLVTNLKAEDVGDNPGQPLLVNLELTALLPER